MVAATAQFNDVGLGRLSGSEKRRIANQDTKPVTEKYVKVVLEVRENEQRRILALKVGGEINTLINAYKDEIEAELDKKKPDLTSAAHMITQMMINAAKASVPCYWEDIAKLLARLQELNQVGQTTRKKRLAA